MKNKFASVIVLYHPADEVVETISSLALDSSIVLVIVNSASDEILKRVAQINGVIILNNHSNVGLAKGLNIGIKYAFDNYSMDFVALFDQDSLPSKGLVGDLVQEFLGVSAVKLACIGPKLVDQKAGNSSYGKNNAQKELDNPRSIPTSGTVISKEAFEAIGPMLESLFIDGIDHEWCLRAYSKGFAIKVSDHLEMTHNMGDLGVNLFGQFKPIHQSPIRHYYIIRNAIYLSKQSYIPISWRMSELLKTIRRGFVYPIVSSDKLGTIRSIYHGVIDGLMDRLGPLNELHPNLFAK
jgi:rhamnosyltransferase